MSNKKRGTIYCGMTNNLILRVRQHKTGKKSFTRKYNLDKLVWFESFHTAMEAIMREKQIKGWLRNKKIALIEEDNPEWKDLHVELIKKYHKKYGKMSDKWNHKEE
jgi:putative endonuclease